MLGGSQPQKSTGGEATPARRLPASQASFLWPASGKFRPDLELSGIEALGVVVVTPTMLSCVPEDPGIPTGKPVCKCFPYLARFSHAAVVTPGLSGNIHS